MEEISQANSSKTKNIARARRASAFFSLPKICVVWVCVHRKIKLLVVLRLETAAIVTGRSRFWRETDTVALDLENRDKNDVIERKTTSKLINDNEIQRLREQLQLATFILLEKSSKITD